MPLEIALPGHEDGRQRHREEACEDHDPLHEFGVVSGAGDMHEPQNGQECTIREAAGHDRADHTRRLAISVWLPGVHRCEAHLRAVADE